MARVTTPVSPIPATVAQNSSASSPSGVSVRTAPSAVTRSSDSTWLPKLPTTWCALPWMSAPIAPPMVTWRVPGSTGSHSPCGSAARIRVSRLTPASTTTRAFPASISWMAASPVMSSTVPPAFCAGSP